MKKYSVIYVDYWRTTWREVLMKKYSVIYADPPWNYKDKCASGKRGVYYKYPLLTTDLIMSLPVRSIAEDDSVLFLWATFPMLEDALAVIPRWGFEYRTVGFVWVKTTKIGGPFGLAWGMGSWSRSNAEICLLATRGRPRRTSCDVHSVILEPRRRHSQKPYDARYRIQRLCGYQNRIELFARKEDDNGISQLGWDLWGSEIPDDECADLGPGFELIRKGVAK